MSEAFTLDTSVLHLTGGGPIGRASNEATFWNRVDRPELREGHVVSVFSYGTTWDYQERHPDGDELAVVLDGDIDFLLDADDEERSIRVREGSAYVVPAGTWHRLAVRAPSTILFITPMPGHTEHRPIESHP